MPELVRMHALHPWRNDDHEGYVETGQIIWVTQRRAEALEQNGLAERYVEAISRVVVVEGPWGMLARPRG